MRVLDRWYARYGLAVVVVILSLWLRWVLIPIIGAGTLYITVYPALFIVAVTLGAGPGVVGMTLAIGLVEAFLVEPFGQLKWSLSFLVRSLILLPASFYVGHVSEKLRAATTRLGADALAARTVEQTVRRLNAELEQRVAEAEAANQALRASQRTALNLMQDAIEARRQAETSAVELRESEARFRLALKNAPVTVAAQDRDLRFLWAYNQRTVRPDDVLGKSDMELFPRATAERLIALKRRVLESGIELRDQLWVESGGRRVYLDLTLEPIRDPAGEITGVGIATVDLTGMRLAQDAADERETELRRTRDLLEAVTGGTDVIIATQDTNLRYTFFNRAYQDEMRRLTGKDLHIGDSMPELFADSPAQQKIAVEAWSRTLRGESSDYRIEFGDPTRHRRIYEVRHAPLRDASGNVVGAGEVAIDVTRQVRTEEALRESQERFRAMAETVPEILFAAKSDGSVDYLNPRFAEYSGVAPEAGYGSGWAECVHPDDRAPMLDRWTESLRTGGVFEFEYRLRRRDGIYRWFISRAQAVRNPLGDVIRWYGAASDISERRQAEEVLRRAHDELEQKVEARTAELRRVNQSLRLISECNQVLVRSANETELVGEICRTIQELGGYRMVWVGYAEHDAAKTVRPVASIGFDDGYLDQARITWADDDRGRGPTGSCIRLRQARFGRDFLVDPELAPWRAQAIERGFRSSLAVPLIAGDDVLGALTVYSEKPGAFDDEHARFLTELTDDLAFGIAAVRARSDSNHARQIAEERAKQLRALTAELIEAEQRERKRLARILHDHLQQLLVGARFGLSGVPSAGKGKRERAAINRVTAILGEAIEVAHSLTVEISPPALQEKGLPEALRWLGREMKRKHGLAVEVHADTDAQPAGEDARLFLYEAVRELLFNVVKHAGVDRAEVSVAKLEYDRIQVTVTDSGAGFDTKTFGEKTPDHARFGLFSIRDRLGFFGGQFEVQSAPGRGSRFTLVVPSGGTASSIGAEPEGEPFPSPSPISMSDGASARKGRKTRVLLADDHPVMRQGLALLLKGSPSIDVVGEAGDGTEAVELTRRLRPDVVLMDVSMPGVSGIEATRQIHSEFPGTCVIGLSMHQDADMEASMRKAGAVAYVVKGGPTQHLMTAIGSYGRMLCGEPVGSGESPITSRRNVASSARRRKPPRHKPRR